MKAAAVIAEYNPFHRGHAWQLREARHLTGADYCVVLMSPDFVQRGEIALTDKYTRTRMALDGGADLVLELPLRYACAGAGYFARGAVQILDQLRCIDVLSFGMEHPDTDLAGRIAEILSREPEPYRRALKASLSRGQSYPAARAAALSEVLSGIDERQSIGTFISSPNNILALEYMKALRDLGSPISVCPVQRRGSYHEEPSGHGDAGGMSGSPDFGGIIWAGAEQIRAVLRRGDPADLAWLERQMGGEPAHLLIRSLTGDHPEDQAHSRAGTRSGTRTGSRLKSHTCGLSDDAPEAAFAETVSSLPGDSLPRVSRILAERDARLSLLVHAQLLRCACAGAGQDVFAPYLDSQEELSRRIVSMLPEYADLDSFADRLQSRNWTRGRIHRVLMQILLDVRREPSRALLAPKAPGYVRILGFRKEAQPLLHRIAGSCDCALITKNADASDRIEGAAGTDPERCRLLQDAYQQDLYASHVWQLIAGRPVRSEYTRSPVVLSS